MPSSQSNRKQHLDLDGPVELLAHSIQNATIALYDLKGALANSAKGLGQDTLLNRLTRSCGQFREEWEACIIFLRLCHEYADLYIDYCDHDCTHSPSESLAPARELHATVTMLCDVIRDLKGEHAKNFEDFRAYKWTLGLKFHLANLLSKRGGF